MAVLPASQVRRSAVPGYVHEEPPLARVVDVAARTRPCVDGLRPASGSETCGRQPSPGGTRGYDGGATVLECAAVMARLRSLLTLVEDGQAYMRC